MLEFKMDFNVGVVINMENLVWLRVKIATLAVHQEMEHAVANFLMMFLKLLIWMFLKKYNLKLK